MSVISSYSTRLNDRLFLQNIRGFNNIRNEKHHTNDKGSLMACKGSVKMLLFNYPFLNDNPMITPFLYLSSGFNERVSTT